MRLPARTPSEAEGLSALAAEIGGKGAGLAALAGLGMPVPPWVPVLASTCDRVLARARTEIDAALVGLGAGPLDRAACEDAARRIARAIREAGFVPADAERLEADLARALPDDPQLAVRSSAIGEDGELDSFAGQLDSFLAVPRADVKDRVLDALASAFGARALLYRRARGLPLDGIRAAVIVQRLVPARRSGVIFTANPTTGDAAEAVVVAGFGLGEGVVGGRVAVDEWTCELASGAVRRAVPASKRTRVVAAAEGGTREEPVPPSDVEFPALSEAEVARLVEMGREIGAAAGVPQDVEWAIDPAGKPWILQARAITTLARGREHVFDGASVVEGYPGLTRPLTFTTLCRSQATTLREAARLLGVPADVLGREARVFDQLYALLEGRVVQDLVAWRRVVGLTPGLEFLLAGLDEQLGVPGRAGGRTRKERRAGRLARLGGRLRLLALLRAHARLADRYVAAVDDERARHARLDRGALDAHALLEELEALSHRVDRLAAAVPLNDLFTSRLHARVGRLLARWAPGDPAVLGDALLGRLTNLESLEPARSFAELAELARAVPDVVHALESTLPPAEAWAAIESEQATRAWRGALGEHLERFGERTVEELKLETPPLSERPDVCVALVRHALVPSALGQGEAPAVAEARAAVERALEGHPLRRAILGWVVRRCREGLRRREALRLARARTVGIARTLWLALGGVLVKDGLLGAREDVFWLGVDELSGLVRGQALDAEPAKVVAARRAAWDAWGRRQPAPRIVTHGTVHARPFPQAPRSTPDRAGELRGRGCCPGKVRGPARVVKDAATAPPVRGHVLVAPSTDPGWIFLMVSAAALVSERGNPLSHTAIVGRELGIPTVVGVPRATERFADGETLEVDGAAGTVKRVAR
ncbi:MAG: PEP/pyruvate-binding domain-containing protein [Anaeromyxobacter sp.]